VARPTCVRVNDVGEWRRRVRVELEGCDVGRPQGRRGEAVAIGVARRRRDAVPRAAHGLGVVGPRQPIVVVGRARRGSGRAGGTAGLAVEHRELRLEKRRHVLEVVQEQFDLRLDDVRRCHVTARHRVMLRLYQSINRSINQ